MKMKQWLQTFPKTIIDVSKIVRDMGMKLKEWLQIFPRHDPVSEF